MNDKKKLAATLYMEDIISKRGFAAVHDPQGYLFSSGRYKTKILPEELPEWYVYGYLYKQHGFISAKGVKHLLYYLIDLYFPQLNIGIECDEGYHKQNVEQDFNRELTIFDILKQVKNISDYLALHVDVTRSYEEIEKEINSHVQTICKSIELQKRNGCFSVWRDISPIEYFKDKAAIHVDDDISFRTIAETCNTLFATEYQNIQQSWFIPSSFRQKYGQEYKVWFPKLAVEGKAVSGGWHNELSQDGKSILEFNESSKEKTYDLKADHYVSRVTFTQALDPITRKREYRFVGVFKLIGAEENKTVYSRIEDSFPLIKP